MTESIETITVKAGPFLGTLRSMQRCAIITPETQFQGGLRASDPEADSPRRLFFGEHTSEESMAVYARLRLAGISEEVKVSGYFKYRDDIYGETFLDERALFVEELEAI